MANISRRDFWGTFPVPLALLAPLGLAGRAWAKRCESLDAIAAGPQDPIGAASDESYWATVQQAFTADRTHINFNNGGVHPAPRIVQESVKRWMDLCNTNSAYQLLSQLPPLVEPVRERLAHEWNVDPEEVAITPNSSESLQ